MDKLKKHLTTEEAAVVLGMHPNTLEKLRCSGGGPVFRKFRRSVRYQLKDICMWSDARRCESTYDENYLLISENFKTHDKK